MSSAAAEARASNCVRRPDKSAKCAACRVPTEIVWDEAEGSKICRECGLVVETHIPSSVHDTERQTVEQSEQEQITREKDALEKILDSANVLVDDKDEGFLPAHARRVASIPRKWYVKKQKGYEKKTIPLTQVAGVYLEAIGLIARAEDHVEVSRSRKQQIKRIMTRQRGQNLTMEHSRYKIWTLPNEENEENE